MLFREYYINFKVMLKERGFQILTALIFVEL